MDVKVSLQYLIDVFMSVILSLIEKNMPENLIYYRTFVNY